MNHDEEEEASQKLFEEVFRAASDGILVASPDGTIRFANPRSLEMFGFPNADLVGSSIDVLIPARHRARHRGHLSEYVRNPVARPMNAGLALSARRSDGSEFPAEISLSPAQLDDGPVVVAIVRDVTEAAKLRAFGAGTVQAAENERRRIAQELHDDTAQRLAAVKLALKRVTQLDPAEITGLCDDLRQEIGAVAQDVSRIARGLMPPELERIGVVESVRIWLNSRVGSEGPAVDLMAEPVDPFLDLEQRLILYRIVQEAVSNVVRHASASTLKVRIRGVGGVVETIVEDDGVGFDPVTRTGRIDGLGLMGMRERAVMVGALVSIGSRPGEGTRVRVVMEKRPENGKDENDGVHSEGSTRR
ncbi:MAG: PAS domain S-box protein [Gemmatimonadetes bacterium]|nr:PAS domain S-box protein [Gemmatimonadota bacterium]